MLGWLYYKISIDGEIKNNEKDKAISVDFLTVHYDHDQHLVGITAQGKRRDDKSQIYDKFPGLHTLIDVLPYMSQDISESESAPFHLPDRIDPNAIYQQRYDTETKEYYIMPL